MKCWESFIFNDEKIVEKASLGRRGDSYRFFDASIENYHPSNFWCAYRARSYNFKELVFADFKLILTYDNIVSAWRWPAETHSLVYFSYHSSIAAHSFFSNEIDLILLFDFSSPNDLLAGGNSIRRRWYKERNFSLRQNLPKKNGCSRPAKHDVGACDPNLNKDTETRAAPRALLRYTNILKILSILLYH